jgi:RNA-directed DNA polymerase
MNVCEPVFERWLISDTFACRQGKGRLAALDRARKFAACHPFFLKLDVRRYFDSVPHDVLYRRLDRLIKDPRLLCLLHRIIGSFSTTPGRGLPIGSLTSQHFANAYLGALDRFVKERLRVTGYVRNQDTDLAGLLRHEYKVDRPEDLTIRQASELIDLLKAPAEG